MLIVNALQPLLPKTLRPLCQLKLFLQGTLWRLTVAATCLALVASLIRYRQLAQQLTEQPCQPGRVETARWLPPHACTPVVYEDSFDHRGDSCAGQRFLPMLHDGAQLAGGSEGCWGQRIPKLLHLIDEAPAASPDDDGSLSLSQHRAGQVDRFLGVNPSWKFAVWRPHELQVLVRDFFPTFVHTVSEDNLVLAKYLILYKFGGLYLDWDFDARAPLDSLLHHSAVLSTLSELADVEYLRQPSPRVILAAPGHPLMLHCLASIKPVLESIASRPGRQSSPSRLDSAVLLAATRRHESFQPQTRDPSRTAYVASPDELLLRLQPTGPSRPGGPVGNEWHELKQILTGVRRRRCPPPTPSSAALLSFCSRANNTATYLRTLMRAELTALTLATESQPESAAADLDPHRRPAGGAGGFSGGQLMQLIRDRGLWKFFPSYSASNNDYDRLQKGDVWKWF